MNDFLRQETQRVRFNSIGIGSLKVTSIQRVENPQYWHRFNTERRVIAQQVAAYVKENHCTCKDLEVGLKNEWQTELSSLGGPRLMKEANEVYLFHGSDRSLDITQTGFEVKYAGNNQGSAYGRGIYFAESPGKVRPSCSCPCYSVKEH